MLRSLTALALVLAAPAFAESASDPASPVAAPALSAEQAAFKGHVTFLAADVMRGRNAGSTEYEIAAHYVAAQMMAAGALPAGDDGSYLQTVPLVSFRLTDKGMMAAGGTALTFGEEYLPAANALKPMMAIDAPVVFVGYGVVAPELGRDDYAGVDVTGKIVAVMAGGPATMPSEIRAHYGNGGTKAQAAAARGAVGIVTLETPTAAKVRPFSTGVASWDHARMTWARADGSPNVIAAAVTPIGTISMAGAEKLFAGSGKTYAATAADAEAGKRVKPRLLRHRLSATSTSTIEAIASSNVAAIIPGSDPVLAKEVVVLSAHLDHVGVGAAVKGDTIYNGAMDNATGIASMIEVARRFQASGERPKRTVMFLAVTAEEKGLVGADYFAQNPTVAKEALVANVNLDMPILTFAFEDVVAFGADRSTLGPMVRAAAEGMGLAYSPDPMPEQGFFTRSDHYRFVQQGIPAVFLWPGVKGPGKAAFDEFLTNHYHKPSDQVTLPIDWQSGVRFVAANYAIAREIANAPERPRWNKGDFFGTTFKGPMTE